jgi:hypothetical protein
VYRLGLRRPELDATNGSATASPVQVWEFAVNAELKPEKFRVPDNDFDFDPATRSTRSIISPMPWSWWSGAGSPIPARRRRRSALLPFDGRRI